MATSTLQRVYGDGNDTKFVVNHSSFCRLLSIGTSWQKIRIAFRFNLTYVAGTLTGTPRLFFGVCSGITNPWNNGTGVTTHALGFLSNLGTWTDGLAAGVYYYSLFSGSQAWPAKRVGTTVTTSLTTSNPVFTCPRTAGTLRQMAIIDIAKGSPNFTVSLVIRPTTSGHVDVSTSEYEKRVQEVIGGAFVGHSNNLTALNIAVDEAADGYFDAVNISWDRSAPVFEFSNLSVYRIL